MDIITSQPTVIPAVASITLDKLWIERLNINGSGLDTKDVPANIVCRPYGVTDGVRTYGPDSTLRRINVADVFAAAETNTTLATALAAVLDAVQELVTAQDTPTPEGE